VGNERVMHSVAKRGVDVKLEQSKINKNGCACIGWAMRMQKRRERNETTKERGRIGEREREREGDR